MPIDLQLATDYNAARQQDARSAFCHAPSVNMYFSQNGDVKVCCHNTHYSIGTYPQQNIREIWNSDKAKKLREYMQKFDLLHGCEVCEFDLSLRGFNEVPARHFDVLPRNRDYPSMMEFLLSNTCNLECVMCKGEFSSLIRKNREKLPPLHSPYDRKFLSQLEEFIPHLHETRFSGSGEAFSIDINYEIWEMLIRLNPGCIIMVQTNGTILTERVKDILERGNFQIGVSLDSVNKDLYEAIRLNANFDKVMDNIRWFSQYSAGRKSRFMLAMCVMRQNRHELPAFIELCNQIYAFAVLHKVWFPSACALHNLPAAELRQIYDSLDPFNYSPRSPLQLENLQQYRFFVSVIKSWMEEAEKREKQIPDATGIPADRLLSLIHDRIANHAGKMELSDSARERVVKTCSDKLEKLAAMFLSPEKETILRLVYLENPAKLIRPLLEDSMEKIYDNAKKFLAQG